jgi:hypothetical protein
MRILKRLVGTVLLLAFAAAPLGVAAEGYVCGFSGKRMVHTATSGACANCQSAAPTRNATWSRPCCIYVGSTPLPPVVASAEAAPLHDTRSAAAPLPGVTAVSGAAISLAGVPQFESGGRGSPPPPVTLQAPLILRN